MAAAIFTERFLAAEVVIIMRWGDLAIFSNTINVSIKSKDSDTTRRTTGKLPSANT